MRTRSSPDERARHAFRSHHDHDRFRPPGAVRRSHEGLHPQALSRRRGSSISPTRSWCTGRPRRASGWRARSVFPARDGPHRGRGSGRGHFARHRGRRVAGHVFLAPDNGLLAPIVARNPDAAHPVRRAALARFGMQRPSATFHGRDIFAPIAAELAAGRCRPRTWGDAAHRWCPPGSMSPRSTPTA